MPNYAAKFSSAYVSSDLMREFIAALPSIMREIYGDRNLVIYYGWASNLHPDLWYKPMSVPLDLLPYFIEDSTEQRIFEFGGSDLLIESPDSNLRILICHESDVHLDGADDAAINKFVARFPQLDFRTADDWKAVHQNGPDAGLPTSEG
jgi:hypothetical protein